MLAHGYKRGLAGAALLGLLAACASPAPDHAAGTASQAPQQQAAAPAAAQQLTGQASDPAAAAIAGELFLVRPAGRKGPLQAYAMPGGKLAFKLPPGMPTADGRRYFASTTLPFNTLLETYDLATGRLLQAVMLDGQWTLSGVSPSGRWLTLTRQASQREMQLWAKTDAWWTDIQVLDAQTGALAQALELEGNFEVETISNQGDALFLVQHLPAVKPDHYLIRLYNLETQALQEDPLRSKGPSDEVMAGLAWEGLATPNGQWLLTLYLSTRRNAAFIHTLNLHNRIPICIDLPSGDGRFSKLKAYSLALAPDGSKLYAVNPLLGVVAEVDMETLQLQAALFAPAPEPTVDTYDALQPGSRSVLAPDGQTLYFSAGTQVWAYDTIKRSVRAPIAVSEQVLGLGVSADGLQLYLADAAGQPRVLEAATGKAVDGPGAGEATSRR